MSTSESSHELADDYWSAPPETGGCLVAFAKLVWLVIGIIAVVIGLLFVAAWLQDHGGGGSGDVVETTPGASETCQRLRADREVARGAFSISNDAGAYYRDLSNISRQESAAGC